MSKQFENIDQLFKQELDLASAKAPAHIKAGIDAKLNASKGRKWWLFLLIPVIAGLIGLPFVLNNDSENNQSGNSVALNDTNDSEDTDQNNTDNHLSVNNSTSEESSITSDDNEPSSFESKPESFIQPNSNSSSSTTTTENSSNKDKITSDNSQKKKTENKTSSDNTKEIRDPEKEKVEIFDQDKITDNGDSESNKTDDSQNKESDNTKTEDADNTTEKVETREDVAENNEGTLKSQNDNTELNTETSDDVTIVDEMTDSTAFDEVDEIVETVQNDSIISDEIVEIDSITTEEIAEIDSTSSQEAEPDIDLEKPKEKFNHWFLTAHGGPKFKRSELTSSDTSVVYSSALSDRAGYGVGMDVNFMLKNGLLFGSGIEYASYSESYDYQKIQTILVDSTITWNVFITDSIVDSVGTTYIYDSTSTTSYNYDDQEIFNQQGRNQTSYLHIPFRFGIQLMGRKWGFDAYAQGRFNLLLKTNAAYVINNQIVTSSLTGSYFDLELGGAVHYNIWKNLYLSGVIRYRPPLRNPYYDPTFQNRMQYLYIGLGASINF